MAALKKERDRLTQWRRARLTRSGYASDWRAFAAWCERTGHNPLPADEETVELYTTWMLTGQGRKTTTVHRHQSAIAYFHKQSGLACPISAKAREVVTGARRERCERPEGKNAIGAVHLRRIARRLGRENTNQSIRDRSVIVLGTAAMLRRSEIVRLRLDDIEFVPKGLLLHIRKSKRDQNGVGKVLGIHRGVHPDTCPVRTVRAWLKLRGKEPGPLFLRLKSNGEIDKGGIHEDAVTTMVKKAVERLGLDPAHYSSHSLRASGITLAADEGANDLEIMERSRHASIEVMRTYIRRANAFTKRNPFRRAL